MILAAQPDFTAVVIGLLGGLALFLFGVGEMSDSLRFIAGSRMRDLLKRLTRNRVMAAATGAVVTAIIQSSSVTTVLLVGFISAGLISLSQSVGVILGANIGSTLTAQIIAFDIVRYALPLITIGFAIRFVSRSQGVLRVGSLVMGFGMLFFGMELMGSATAELRTYPPFIDAMRGIGNPFLAILLGAAFTAIIQSSAATAGIVIVLSGQGLIPLETGIAIVIGSNIGTCATAVLAALGRPRAAMQAAFVHVAFNLGGALLWVWFIHVLADLVRVITPGALPRQIANAHTVFNVVNTLIFLPFTVPLARLVQWILPEKEEAVMVAKPKYLDDVYLDTPALAIERVRLEVGRLGRRLADILGAAPPLRSNELTSRLEQVETLGTAILDYARRLGSRRLPKRESWHLEHLLAVVTNLQSISDTLRYNAGELRRQAEAEKIAPSEETRRRFAELLARVTDALRYSVRAVEDIDLEAAERVVAMKKELVALADELARHLGKRLTADDPARLATYRIETQAIEILKRIYYFAKRIARTVSEDVEELEVVSVA